jgi:GDP-D-mannose dehydratase
MSDRVAFITGVTGQDGAYLAELLLGKRYYVVHGAAHRDLQSRDPEPCAGLVRDAGIYRERGCARHGNRYRFYQASTSELYSKVQEAPQRETTPFYLRSPYAAPKVYGYPS